MKTLDELIEQAGGEFIEKPKGSIKIREGYAFTKLGHDLWRYVSVQDQHISDVSSYKQVWAWYRSNCLYMDREAA